MDNVNEKIKESVNSEESESSKRITMRDITWILIGIVLGILIGMGVFVSTMSSSVEQIQSPQVTLPSIEQTVEQ